MDGDALHLVWFGFFVWMIIRHERLEAKWIAACHTLGLSSSSDVNEVRDCIIELNRRGRLNG